MFHSMRCKRHKSWYLVILSLVFFQAGCAHTLGASAEAPKPDCSHNLMPTTVATLGIVLVTAVVSKAILDGAEECYGGLSCLERLDNGIGAALVAAGGGSIALGVFANGVHKAAVCQAYLEQVEEKTNLKSQPSEQ